MTMCADGWQQRTAAAVEAYRRSVVDGKRGAISRPRRSGPLRPASQSTVTFADTQPRSSLESPSPSPPTTLASSPPFARPRTRTHGPSPLAPPAFRRAHVTTGSASSTTSSTAPLLSTSAPASMPASPERATFPDPGRRERPAGNSALDPTASDSQRWSWRRLLTGPGFSFAQLGIGTGNDRLSAGSSSLNHWEEENPEYPIGFAYTPEDVQAVRSRTPPEHGHPLPDLDYPPEYFDYSKEEKASVHD